MTDYQTIKTAFHNRIAVITLNRPEVLNALNQALMHEITDAITKIDQDPNVAVTIITGEGRAFAAGADIKEMATQGFADMYMGNFFAEWDRFAQSRKPIIAAINGFALGGGCELAMMCDILIASEKAKFGQPEIKLGVTPGMGGSIRLAKLIGKARAFDMVLTGKMITAEEALNMGLISRMVAHDDLMTEAMAVAETIAGYSLPSLMAAKEMIGVAMEASTHEGLRFERRLFMGLFGTLDQKEGMQAFVDKRPAQFKDC